MIGSMVGKPLPTRGFRRTMNVSASGMKSAGLTERSPKITTHSTPAMAYRTPTATPGGVHTAAHTIHPEPGFERIEES